MSAPLVCALVGGPGADRTLQAVAAGSQRPQRVVLLHSGDSPPPQVPGGETELVRVRAGAPAGAALRGAVEAARRRPLDWLWVLGPRTRPRPESLQALLRALDKHDSLPAPLLLASRVLDGDGRVHPDAVPRHEVFEKEVSVAAAAAHMVQLRALWPGSLLISVRALERFGGPRADFGDGAEIYEWSARMLRSWADPGYLVTDSLVVSDMPPRSQTERRRRRWLARARLLSDGAAWSPLERLWEAYVLVGELPSMLAAPQGRAGTGAPGARPSRSPRSTGRIASRENRL